MTSRAQALGRVVALSVCVMAGPAAAQKPPSNSFEVSADLKSCEGTTPAACKTALARKYGRPASEDAHGFRWTNYRGKDAPGSCYEFAISVDRNEVTGRSFMQVPCK